jgi:CHAD domain-containing protein
MSSSTSYPVQVLREHLTNLEAAMSVCLADPGHKPVHKLRTETRRVEALLLLLALVPGLPEHRKEAAALLRALARLRRAAGEVRDLDVHRKMLEALTGGENGEAVDTAAEQAQDRPAGKSVVPRPKLKSVSAPEAGVADGSLDPLGKAAKELRKEMARARDRAADDLQDLLNKRQAKTARVAEKLLAVLEPANGLALPAPDLLRDAEAVLTRDGLLKADAVAKLDEEDLHTVRKAAKAARYVAESLPDDRTLVQAAEGFEALQEAGGQWHDALELARAARRYFGKGHQLTAAYREERDRKLEAYRSALMARVQEKGAARRRPTKKVSGKRRRVAA